MATCDVFSVTGLGMCQFMTGFYRKLAYHINARAKSSFRFVAPNLLSTTGQIPDFDVAIMRCSSKIFGIVRQRDCPGICLFQGICAGQVREILSIARTVWRINLLDSLVTSDHIPFSQAQILMSPSNPILAAF